MTQLTNVSPGAASVEVYVSNLPLEVNPPHIPVI